VSVGARLARPCYTAAHTEGRQENAMAMKNPPTAPVTPPIVPHLVVQGGVDAAAFYERAFGAKAELMKGPDGRIMHGMLTLPNGGVFFLMEPPESTPVGQSNVVIHLEVADVDASWKQATAAGCKVVMELADQFWGARYGIVSDPFGHTWSLATQKRDVSPEELERAAKKA
jgi:PhnB protein